MKFYKFLLIKAYFDKGYGLTNYFKYLLAFVGIFDLIDAKTAIYSILIYLLFCFILGWAWFKFGFVDTENEIQNRFNPFQKEIRRKLRSRKV